MLYLLAAGNQAPSQEVVGASFQSASVWNKKDVSFEIAALNLAEILWKEEEKLEEIMEFRGY